MISGRRVNDFGLPRPQERPDVVRREIIIDKAKGESAGLKLMRYDDELYVVKVVKSATNNQMEATSSTSGTTLSVDHIGPTPSAAFRAGLTFGDRIECIDDLTATILSTMDMRALYEYLASSTTMKLTVADRPLFWTYTLQSAPIQGHVGVGITYGNQQIVRVETHSIAHKAGMQTGHTIIEINGKCCLGKSDEKVRKMIAKMVNPAKTVNPAQESDDANANTTANTVLAMPKAAAGKFRKALQGFINVDAQLKESVKQNLYAFDKDGHRMPQKRTKMHTYVDHTLSLYQPSSGTVATNVQKKVSVPQRLLKEKSRLLKTVISSSGK